MSSTPSTPTSYCDFVTLDRAHPVHRAYHDTEYGFPSDNESVLFERLTLEIFQAGLSWETILKKREGFQKAFDGFEVDKVAAYGPAEIERLLGDPGIIRNRLKIEAAIHNARVIQSMRETGGFAAWIKAQGSLDKPEWVKRFKKMFKFVGGEIVGEFLMSLGYLPGAHVPGCPIYEKLKLG